MRLFVLQVLRWLRIRTSTRLENAKNELRMQMHDALVRAYGPEAQVSTWVESDKQAEHWSFAARVVHSTFSGKTEVQRSSEIAAVIGRIVASFEDKYFITEGFFAYVGLPPGEMIEDSVFEALVARHQ